MNKDCLIKVINAEESGVSQRTGNSWRKRTLVLAWNEEALPGFNPDVPLEQMVAVAVFNEKCDILNALNPHAGMWINCDLQFTTRMFGNSVNTEVVIHNIKPIII